MEVNKVADLLLLYIYIPRARAGVIDDSAAPHSLTIYDSTYLLNYYSLYVITHRL